ncbi:MAG TPA: hypothetical protein VGO16_07060 [Pseudonocardiaceae bacterium]|nr:hypothetical protein [Pseudonocardiaceae bacterium]
MATRDAELARQPLDVSELLCESLLGAVSALADFDSVISWVHRRLAVVDEFGERSVLDIGCGSGTFASLLASRGRPGVVSEGW